MTIISNLIKTEQNGIEFYTVESTGESGISQSGLAKLSGVVDSTVSNFAKTLSNSESLDSSKVLPRTVFEKFTLSIFDKKAVVNGKNAGNLKVYKSDFCVQAISYFASKGKKEALFSMTKFAKLGFDTWVQQITGWKPPQTIAPSIPQIEPELTPRSAVQLIRDAIALGDKLGGFNKEEQAMVRSQLAKAIRSVRISKAVEEVPVKDPAPVGYQLPAYFTISERAYFLGHKLTNSQAISAGKFAARMYREERGKDPYKSKARLNKVNGFQTVNVYLSKDVHITDLAIDSTVRFGGLLVA